MPERRLVPGLADRLKTKREAAGLSQGGAAERSGVHRLSILKFEGEKAVPTLDVLYRLAAAYGVNVCDLLPGGVLPGGVLPADAGGPMPANDGKKGARLGGAN